MDWQGSFTGIGFIAINPGGQRRTSGEYFSEKRRAPLGIVSGRSLATSSSPSSHSSARGSAAVGRACATCSDPSPSRQPLFSHALEATCSAPAAQIISCSACMRPARQSTHQAEPQATLPDSASAHQQRRRGRPRRRISRASRRGLLGRRGGRVRRGAVGRRRRRRAERRRRHRHLLHSSMQE